MAANLDPYAIQDPYSVPVSHPSLGFTATVIDGLLAAGINNMGEYIARYEAIADPDHKARLAELCDGARAPRPGEFDL